MNKLGPFKIGNSKNSIPTTLQVPPEPLLVKELAAALGVSPRFVYQMRACGFLMFGDTRQREMATLEEARAWIKKYNFRLIKSAGIINSAKSFPTPAQPQVAAVQTAEKEQSRDCLPSVALAKLGEGAGRTT